MLNPKCDEAWNDVQKGFQVISSLTNEKDDTAPTSLLDRIFGTENARKSVNKDDFKTFVNGKLTTEEFQIGTLIKSHVLPRDSSGKQIGFRDPRKSWHGMDWSRSRSYMPSWFGRQRRWGGTKKKRQTRGRSLRLF